jgi:hypothetical protein
MTPVCTGFPASSKLVGLNRLPTYLGGLAGVVAPLLLASGAAVAPLLLLLVSTGAIAGAAGGAGAGAALSELLQAVSMTAAAASALRASFVFIDESPKCKERT